MKSAKHIILALLFLTLFFVAWHFSLAQSNVGVEGYVPQTELNKHQPKDQEINLKQTQPITKENKYLYFFEKFLSEQQLENEAGQIINHSKYDLVASYAFMLFILLILAIITLAIIGFFDRLLSGFRKKYVHKTHT